ncbi:DHA1 family bicyclomycin/chloramphenicol resistance-like MFS transporter [Rhizobium sp. BK313]|uniref:multidrug effflux MFS transporter n=1 Tax=Rhizobium sp. BK313 TaxID=2587081 RepID=UPI0010F1C3F8|nr:multidrug effflux MFS transporter [Rhizobium sp. BK313]MBB3454809.1 DHA1 family bicyclomycin/chloramphenicol resistance-like MFS transporter [Rhizobium sp. BK313]
MLDHVTAEEQQASPETEATSLMADVLSGDARESTPMMAAERSTQNDAASHGWRVLAVLSALMGFASISTDLYLPAMPAMGRDLGVDAGVMQLTVSGFLIGFSVGQLLWGPIGDRYGRRLPVSIGLMLFILGSAGCAMSGSASSMIGWRMVQAVGACAGVVLSRAMVRDLYAGNRAAQMLSTLITVMAIAPLLGPIVGAQILAIAGWRAIFWTLVGVGLLTLAALFTLPETLPTERRNQQSLARAIVSYGTLLRDRRLLGYAGAGGFFYAGIYAYIAGTPFAYITYHHVPPQLYGLLFAVGIVGIMMMNLVNSRLVMRAGSERLLVYGTGAAAFAGILLGAAAWTGWGGLWGLAVPLFLFVSASGLIIANSIAGPLADFPERAGSVSALVGAIHYGSGIFGSALIGTFANGTPWPMGWVIGIAGVGSFLCAGVVSSARRQT